MRILLVEPDAPSAAALELNLKANHAHVYTTDLGEEAVDLAKLYDYDLVITELALSDMHGFDVIRQIRLAKVPTPILVLSGYSSVEDRIRALGYGADDYMTKPFHKDELLARVHAIVRRSRGYPQNAIKVGDLEIDIGKKVVSWLDKRIHLSGKEYAVMELLAMRKNTVCTKDMVLNHLYSGRDEPELKIVDVFICKLRKKFRLAGAGDVIETIWGRGYSISDRAEPDLGHSAVAA